MVKKSGSFIKKKVKGMENGFFYCEDCGGLLAKGKLAPGSSVEFKCRKCNNLNSITFLKTGQT